MPSKVKKHNGQLVWQSDESGWESDGFGSRTKSVFLLDDGSLEIQEPLWCGSGLEGQRRRTHVMWVAAEHANLLLKHLKPDGTIEFGWEDCSHPYSSLLEFMTYEGPPFKGGHRL